MPAPGSGILSFGLVAIPVKIHTAINDQSVSFNLLHKKCGSRLRKVPKGDSQRVTQQELNLGEGLIDRMFTDKFEPEQYRDEYRLRVLAVIDEKVKTGKEITTSPQPTRKPGPVIDLMEALKQACGKFPRKKLLALVRRGRKREGGSWRRSLTKVISSKEPHCWSIPLARTGTLAAASWCPVAMAPSWNLRASGSKVSPSV
jgi:non-homologous end joining protein Ku